MNPTNPFHNDARSTTAIAPAAQITRPRMMRIVVNMEFSL
jgi:hypothetical protein